MQRKIKRLKADLRGSSGTCKRTATARCWPAHLCGQDVRRALRDHAAGSAKEAVSRAGLCPGCSLEPVALRPQQHRWWDEPGGALCAWLVTKRRKNSWCIHTLGKGTKHGQHRQLCPLAHGHEAQKQVTPAVLPEPDVVPGGSGRERVGLGGVWGLCLC